MDIFDPSYVVKMRELIFLEYNNNKFIDRKMIYVIDKNYRYNTV